MAQVKVQINGKSFEIACDDGQEAHLMRLGTYIDKRIGELVAAVGQVGNDRLLVMASLLIADELSDAYAELEELRAKDQTVARKLALEEDLAQTIDQVADRIEDIAERLERA
ncbi:MAG: cell division protein ZapA [Magnetovibrionaceae bacterium]